MKFTETYFSAFFDDETIVIDFLGSLMVQKQYRKVYNTEAMLVNQMRDKTFDFKA